MVSIRTSLFELDVIIKTSRLSTGLRALDHAVGKFRSSAQAKFNISAFLFTFRVAVSTWRNPTY